MYRKLPCKESYGKTKRILKSKLTSYLQHCLRFIFGNEMSTALDRTTQERVQRIRDASSAIFMDDLLTGADTVGEARKIRDEIIQIL